MESLMMAITSIMSNARVFQAASGWENTTLKGTVRCSLSPYIAATDLASIDREPNGTEILVDFIYLISEAELAAKQHEGGSPKDEGSSPQV